MVDNAKKIVNMGCIDSESCPAMLLSNVIEWNIEDPNGKSIDEIRKIRDGINLKIQELVSGLNTDS